MVVDSSAQAPNIAKVGWSPKAQKNFYYLWLPRLQDWPAALSLPSRHFGLFLACDARGVADETIRTVASRALDQGLASLGAWGPDCERVHDRFDDVKVPRDPQPTDGSVIMTTWYGHETLKKSLWYFVYVQFAADDYEATCRSWLAVLVGRKDWAAQVRRSLAAFVSRRARRS